MSSKRSSSSRIAISRVPPPPPSRQKKPLRDFNNAAAINASSSSSSCSSSVSIEAPKGCLKSCFFQHTRRPQLLTKKTTLLRSRKTSKPKNKSSDLTLPPLSKHDDNSDTDKAVTTTPPIEATVSPEIQCGSAAAPVGSFSTTTTTPVCYGAGHVLSGVTDKRKCKPRGLLVVNENQNLDFDKSDSPIEASMHWLSSSPCKEGDEQIDRIRLFPKGSVTVSVTSPNACSFSSGLSSVFKENTSTSTFSMTTSTSTTSADIISSIKRRMMSTTFLNSPSELLEFQGLFGSSVVHREYPSPSEAAAMDCKIDDCKEEGRYHVDANSPISSNSLSSGNVMRTPESESSPENHVRYPWLTSGNCKNPPLNSEFISVADELVRMRRSLSPKTHESILESVCSGAQLADGTTPFSSIDNVNFQKALANGVSWKSDSTSENISLSQMRISWRDGLVSRIFDMDELDCCRCLSDDEEEHDGLTSMVSKCHQDQELNIGFKDDKSEDKEKSCPQPCSHAEIISNNGAELVASGFHD